MKILASNRRGRFDYDIKETLLAGIVLTGAEVKSVKSGQISLKGSYVNLINGEPYLINAHISPYKYASQSQSEPTRSRKLLLHRRELDEITAYKRSGLTLVPLAAGLERGFVKIRVGIGRGRKRADKRDKIKQREAKRTVARAVRAINKGN